MTGACAARGEGSSLRSECAEQRMLARPNDGECVAHGESRVYSCLRAVIATVN